MHGDDWYRPVAGLLLVAALTGCSDTIVEPTSGVPSGPVALARPGFVFPGGCCFYEDLELRTVVPPAAAPKEGLDNFYGFPAGAAAGQKGVVGVAPGDTDYHGGKWKFHAVTWNVLSYQLTSEAAVLAAASVADVTIARIPDNDFKCPIQP